MKIGPSETLALTIIYICTKVFLGLPRSFIEIGGTAGWTMPILSGLLAIPLWLLVGKLLERFPHKSIVQIINEVFGSLLGTGINLIFMGYLILTTGNLLRQFGETVIITALPSAPISSLAFLFIIPMAAAAYLGMEPIIRAVFIASPFVIFGTVSILFFLMPFWDFTQIYPLFGNGLIKLASYSLPLTSAFGEVIILGILTPYFAFQGKKVTQIGVASIIISALFFSFSTLIYQIVISYPSALESLVPYYQLARSIYLGRFFQRVEAVYILFWTFTAFLRLAVGLYLGCYLLKETFQIPYLRPLIPAVAMTYLSLSLTPADLMQTVLFEKYRILVGSFFSFGIPLGVFAVALIRGKRGEPEHAQK